MAVKQFWRTTSLVTLFFSLLWSDSVCSGDEVTTQPTRPQRPGLVVVIRGLAGYWPGCDSFCQKVRGYGETVVDYTPMSAAGIGPDVADEMRSGRWSHLRIVGYSFGGDAAVDLASELNGYGVRIERLILIEATTPGDVPGNVGYCFNVFESRPKTDWLPMFRGIQVRAVPSKTYLVNYDVRRTGSRMNRLNHFTFATDSQLQSIVAYQAGAPSRGSSVTAGKTEQATDPADLIKLSTIEPVKVE